MPLGDFLELNVWRPCLVVPSPMTSKFGQTQDGKPSQHTLDSTGARRFLVAEFDSGGLDEHAAVIWHLRKFLPLVMVLHSGGKSLHAWWNCGGFPEERLLRFFRYAVSLGADPPTWTRSQFVRVPQGWREDKQAVQAVHFFNPACLPDKGGADKKEDKSE